MKIIITTLATLLSATAAFAGNVTYVAPEVVMIEEPASMGGSGAWLIPLVIVAVLALALTQNNEKGEPLVE